MLKRVGVVAVALVALLGGGCGKADAPSAPSTAAPVDTFPSGDVRLAYRLDLPAGAGPFPAIVMGHGSAPATRFEFAFEAQRLVAAGFAVLRYDKRGVGASEGVYEIAGNVANSERVFPILAGYYSSLVEYSPSASLDEAYARSRVYAGPHGFDPRSTLDSLPTPGLWLLGGVDRSIPTPLTVDVLQSLQDSGRPYRWIVYPGVDHNMNMGGVDFMGDAVRFLEPWR